MSVTTMSHSLSRNSIKNNATLLPINNIYINNPTPYWKELKENAVIKHYKRQETIYLNGANMAGIYLVLNGMVMLSQLHDSGIEIGHSVITPRCTFGEFEVLNQSTSEQIATTLSNCLLCTIPAKIFNNLSANSNRFSFNVAKLMSQRLHRSECHHTYIASRSVPQRLSQLLIELAHNVGFSDQLGLHFSPCLTHHDMAILVASSRETVSSIMADLRRQKIIEFDRQHVSILNEHALANF